MADDETTEPTDDAAHASEGSAGAAAGGSVPTWVVAVAAVVAFVVVGGVGWAISSAASSDDGDEAAEPVAVEGDAYELPVLEPVAVGGFERADLSAAAAAEEEMPTPDPENEPVPEGAQVIFPEVDPVLPVPAGEVPPRELAIADEEAPEGASGGFIADGLPEPAERTIIVPGEEPTGPVELREPAEEATTTTTDGSASSTTVGDGADPDTPTEPGETPGDDGEPPLLVDECADEDPPAECEDGIGGTIRPFGDEALLILGASAAPERRCLDQVPEVPRDRVQLAIRTDQLAELDITYTPDTDPEDERTLAVTTPDSEERAVGAGFDVFTCALLDRIDGAERYDVTVNGHAIDGGPDGFPWIGTIDLDAEDERPPVRIIPRSSRLLDVFVPASEAEVVEVWRIRRNDEPDSRCGIVDDETLPEDLGPLDIERRDEQESIHVSSAPPEWDTLRRFSVPVDDESAVDLCVIWYRDLEPQREVVERQSWLLLPPAHPDVDLVATEFIQAGRDVQLSTMPYDGAVVDIRSLGTRVLCNDSILRSEIDELGEKTFCTFEVTPDNSILSLAVGPIASVGQPVAANRRGLTLQTGPCPAPDPSACTEEYRVAIPAPPEGGEPAIFGTLVFEARYGAVPIRGSEWAILDTGTFATEDTERPDLPQLDLGLSGVEMDPENPLRVLVHWQTDRPVQAVNAVNANREPGRCQSGGHYVTTATEDVDFGGDRGTIPLNICPSTSYDFSLQIIDLDGNRVNFSARPRGPDGVVPEYRWPGGSFRTDPVRLEISASLAARSSGGLNPGLTRVPLSLEQTPTPVSQSTSGLWDTRYVLVGVNDVEVAPENRYGALECGRAHSHDLRTSEPLVVEAGSEVLFRLHTQMYRVDQCMPWGRVPWWGEVWANWYSEISEPIPVRDLLDDDGVRVTKWVWTAPDWVAECYGDPAEVFLSMPTVASAQEEFQRWVAFQESYPTPTSRSSDTRDPDCPTGSNYRISADVTAALAPPGPASAEDGIEVAI